MESTKNILQKAKSQVDNGAKRAINLDLTSGPSFLLTGLMILDKTLNLWTFFSHSKDPLRLNKASLKVKQASKNGPVRGL